MHVRGEPLVGVLAVAGAVFVTASLAYGPAPRAERATRTSVAGTCHPAPDPNELFATISDTAPVVACEQPHQTETVWQQPITGPLARLGVRPNPELLHATLDSACDDYWRIRAYLGADAHDDNWGISTLLKVPTPAEWAAGDRTLRCDATAGAPGLDGPVLTQSLMGVLRRADSARFRLCGRAALMVTCDQLHDAEAMSPNVNVPGAQWPGQAGGGGVAVADCTAIADQYLGGPLRSRPGLAIRVDLPTFGQWSTGDHSANCWLANAAGQYTVGTLRGGLR